MHRLLKGQVRTQLAEMGVDMAVQTQRPIVQEDGVVDEFLPRAQVEQRRELVVHAHGGVAMDLILRQEQLAKRRDGPRARDVHVQRGRVRLDGEAAGDVDGGDHGQDDVVLARLQDLRRVDREGASVQQVLRDGGNGVDEAVTAQ